MLREIKDVQKPNEPYRRWFEDNYFDLIVWYKSESSKKMKEIIGFQLCYNRFSNEKALTWFKDKGFTHDTVDDSKTFGIKYTPILVADGIFPTENITIKFKDRSKNIDKEIVNLVLDKIKEYDIKQ